MYARHSFVLSPFPALRNRFCSSAVRLQLRLVLHSDTRKMLLSANLVPNDVSNTRGGRVTDPVSACRAGTLHTYHCTVPGTRPCCNILPDNTSFSPFGITAATSSRSCLRTGRWWVLPISCILRGRNHLHVAPYQASA
jgi:hypothetical protein